MDLISILRAAGDTIKQVNHYSASIEDAEKVCQSFRSKLNSTHKLLTSLEALVKEDYGDAYASMSSASQDVVVGSKRNRSIVQLIKDEGELDSLRNDLEEISECLKTLKSEPSTRSSLKQLSPVQRRLEKEQLKKIMAFSSKMEEFKATAALVLTVDLRYDRLLAI